MNATDSIRPRRRWIVWCTRAALLVAVVGGGVGGAVYYYLFGREGAPVESREIRVTSDPVAERWGRLDRLADEIDRALRDVDDLQATLYKQERIDDRLEPVATMLIKQRRQPLSIYLRWEEPSDGREVIFQMHKRGNRLIAHEGGTLGQVVPVMLMNRDNPLAQQFSRHPINELSVQFVRRMLPMYVEDARANPQVEILIEEHDVIRDRPCIHLRLIHPAGSDGPTKYHRFDLYVDDENYLPVRWELYDRDPDGNDQLLEYFELEDVEVNVGLTDEDFDPDNEAYGFGSEPVLQLDPARRDRE